MKNPTRLIQVSSTGSSREYTYRAPDGMMSTDNKILLPKNGLYHHNILLPGKGFLVDGQMDWGRGGHGYPCCVELRVNLSFGEEAGCLEGVHPAR